MNIEQHETNTSIDYERLKQERPDLFEPIPERIGVNAAKPEGYPTGTVEDWRGKDDPNNLIEIQESGEPLVNIANLTPPIFASNDYGWKLGSSGYEAPLDGSTVAQYARKSVVEMLQGAQASLPEGYKLIMFDGWRSLETQLATYDMCYASLVERLVGLGVLASPNDLPAAVKELIIKETTNYISLPSPLPPSAHPTEKEVAAGQLVPSPHNTGGSVDVGIVVIDTEWRDKLARLEDELQELDDPFSIERAKVNFRIAYIYRMHSTSLDFGTAFDFAGQESNLLHFEGADNIAQDSRRILYNAMINAGFQPYSEEWWHFNYGNQMAKMTEWRATGRKEAAIYGGIELSEEQLRHERVHGLTIGLLIECEAGNREAISIPPELAELGVTIDDIQALADTVGDPRLVRSLPKTYDMKYRGEIPDYLIASITSALRSTGQ